MDAKKIYKILSYIGPLFIISLFVPEKNDKGVKLHCGQGMLLFVLDIILAVLCKLLGIIPIIGGVLAWIVGTVAGLVILAAMILGIIYAITDRNIPLPYIGTFAFYK